MFRIGEFSKLTQVSVRMLRYYDETGILTPAEADKWTGKRQAAAYGQGLSERVPAVCGVQ